MDVRRQLVSHKLNTDKAARFKTFSKSVSVLSIVSGFPKKTQQKESDVRLQEGELQVSTETGRHYTSPGPQEEG